MVKLSPKKKISQKVDFFWWSLKVCDRTFLFNFEGQKFAKTHAKKN